MSRQNEIVLSRLKRGEKLTSLDAVVKYGIQDLPKRISELRAMGYKISDIREDGVNRYGFDTHWKVYWMPDAS